MPATADSDYYAVLIQGQDEYKIFTKLSQCTAAVYQSGENRVLFNQDLYWRIGTFKNDQKLDCENFRSVVEEEFWTTEIKQMPPQKREVEGYQENCRKWLWL